MIRLTLLVIPLLLLGCMRYQYATVSSKLNSNDQKEFVHENDSLIVKYNFSGNDCPVKISIENKLERPLFIDWKRSALIINDVSQPYSKDKAVIDAYGAGTTFIWGTSSASQFINVQGTITRSESPGFIPPRSKIESDVVYAAGNYKKLKGRKSKPIRVYSADSYSSAKHYEFNEDNSPVGFRCYLSLSADPDFRSLIVYDDKFWVTEIVQTDLSPKMFYKNSNKGNIYHTAKFTGIGTGAALVGLSGLAFLAGTN
jgi:hypothetical protein